ncbi:protein-glutamate methylesterase/protein-glutamine glutaminase [Marinimicrobium agarilyticum]|uniref:protein-glutamate methylesterase/protein-glutamine glutaminase n=1 Tax=Marinimicrobium agarilyticum TaxID=306546 RepID=UPI0003F58F0C|nr:chemotaxis response regulator protein-glutamate methylesterase [Marinimicrobium agarilyticum]
MPLRVLVVDDSNFFRQRLKEMIDQHPDLSVVGTATNGREAVEQARSLRPDLVTMDFEMPEMDGITAVKHIMAERPVPILMFSSLTYEGARITLDALAAGAMDFMPKDFGEVSRSAQKLRDKLHERLLTLGKQAKASASATREATKLQRPVPAERPAPAPREPTPAPRMARGSVKLLVIGASTGGPVALTDVLVNLPANFPVPIVLVQHMPENFTRAFAERLDRQCQIRVREAVDGDSLEPGLALLAPGGKQLMLDGRGGLKIVEDQRMTYRPSLDITFGSAAKHYGNRVLGVVLTGMGADGREGARMLKQEGATIWSQDEASCVIYGMPMAVAKAGLSDKVLSLKEIGPRLSREVC